MRKKPSDYVATHQPSKEPSDPARPSHLDGSSLLEQLLKRNNKTNDDASKYSSLYKRLGASTPTDMTYSTPITLTITTTTPPGITGDPNKHIESDLIQAPKKTIEFYQKEREKEKVKSFERALLLGRNDTYTTPRSSNLSTTIAELKKLLHSLKESSLKYEESLLSSKSPLDSLESTPGHSSTSFIDTHTGIAFGENGIQSTFQPSPAQKELTDFAWGRAGLEKKQNSTPAKVITASTTQDPFHGLTSKEISDRLEQKRQESMLAIMGQEAVKKLAGKNERIKELIKKFGLHEDKSKEDDLKREWESLDKSEGKVGDNDILYTKTRNGTDFSGTFGNLAKMAQNKSRVINWMIKNMPEGKQTIFIL